jgi:D-arabinose 1-dehydrogenase-like Zn-dependent alcohol dehydrogenase
MKQLTLIGSTHSTPEDTEQALKAAADGHLHIKIDRVMPLSQAAEAHRLVESCVVSGKIVLSPVIEQ